MKEHLITLMIILPFVGAVAQALIPQLKGKRGDHELSSGMARWCAMVSSVFASICGLFLVISMKTGDLTGGTTLYARETLAWVGSYAITYDVAIDGLSAPLMLLVSIVFPLLIVSEWKTLKNPRGIHGLLLILQASLLGAICAQDLFLAFFFWALTTLPFYFLMAMWGGAEREAAAFRYIITASIGNVFLFIAMILVYYAIEPHTFSIQTLLGGKVAGKTIGLFGHEFNVAGAAFLFLSISMILRVPIWPFHGWFTTLATQSTASVAIGLCGVFVPVAIYFFTRISFSLFPVEIAKFASVIVLIGAGNVIFGAIGAVAKKDLRLFMAFLCLCQVGFLLIGLGSLDELGVVGAIYQELALGLGLSGFGLFAGLMYTRTGKINYLDDSDRPVFGGVVAYAPALALVTGVIAVSLLGLPALGGFVGQILIIMGSYAAYTPIVLVLGVGLILMTYGLFSVYRHVFFGGSKNEAAKFSDLSWGEKGYMLPIVGMLLFLGLYPKPLLELVKPTVLELLSIMK